MELNIKKIAAITLLATYGALAMPACHDDGPAENLGEHVDEAAHDAKRAVDDATD